MFTKQAATNEEIQTYFEALECYFDTAKEGITIHVKEKDRFIKKYVNPRASVIFGYSHDELFSMNASDLCFPDDLPHLLDCQKRRISPVVFRAQRKDGKIIWVENSYRLVEEKVRITTTREITHLKEAESMRRSLEAFSEITDFSAAFSDKFGNFCQALDLLMNMSGSSLMENDIETARQYLDRMKETLNAAKPLADLFNKFGKYNNIHRTNVQIHELISTLVFQTLKEPLREAKVVPTLTLEGAPVIPIDQEKIIIALTEIIQNGITAMLDNRNNPVHQLTITSKLVDQEHLQISISDNGIGIPKDYLSKIGKPLLLAHDNRHFGFGLTFAKFIVKLHGGSFEIETRHRDEYGSASGTTVTLYLPLT